MGDFHRSIDLILAEEGGILAEEGGLSITRTTPAV
jgi:hypothetical protein